MPRVKGRRGNKMPVCVTCLISCTVFIAVLVIALIIGANVAFNKFISPQIGGVTLSECNKLVKGLFKSKRDTIVTDEYTQEDLNEFYAELNSMLYQKEKTDEEIREEYDASDEKKNGMDYDTYAASHRYRITVDSLLGAVDLNELSGQNSEVAAAEDEEQSESEDTLTSLFKQLSFDFSKLKDYPYTQEEEDTSYTTFELEPNHVAALIGEIFPKILKSFDTSSTPLGGADISEFFKIPQIRAYYKLDEGAENRDKSLALRITAELYVDELITKLVQPMLEEQGVNGTIVGFVKKILPKRFYVTVEVLPLDETQELTVSINNYTEKQSNDLKKIVNALSSNSNFNIFPTDTEASGSGSEQTEESKNLFVQANSKVVEVFVMINDYAPIQFVPKGQSVTLKLAHIQALLSAMQMYDPSDLENSVTPHMFLTTLRCLFDTSKVQSNAEVLDSFYDRLESNYGVDAGFWKDHSLFDTDAISEVPSLINLNDVTFKSNEEMKVLLSQGQLTELLTGAASSGFFNENGELAAAEDDSSFSIANAFTFESVVISKIDEGVVNDYSYTDSNDITHNLTLGSYAVYDLSLKASLGIIDLLSQGDDSDIMKSLSELLPERLTVAIIIKIKDVYDASGKLFDRVIGGDAGSTSFEINKFNEYYTDKVLTVFKLMVSRLSGGEGFDSDSIITTVESGFDKVFSVLRDNLYCDVLLNEKTEGGNKKGYIVLPSIYELVQGFAQRKIDSDGSAKENLTVEELEEVFSTLYNSDIVVIERPEDVPEDPSSVDKIIYKFDEGAADDFLADFSRKYYLNETISKEKIFGEDESGLANLISVDNINFKGYIDDDQFIKGLYNDEGKTLNDLRVKMTGEQLCALINSSGAFSGEDMKNDLLKSFEMLNCEHTWIDDVLYLDIEIKASVSLDSEDDSSFNVASLVPTYLFLTARILLYSDDYTDKTRFEAEILINGKDSEKLVKLINIFSGDGFNTDDITNTVSDAIKAPFDNIEGNVNLIYDQGTTDALFKIDTVYNTINKMSHKNDSPAYVSDWSSDEALMTELREFGREPVYSTKDVEYKEDIVKVVDSADIPVSYFSEAVKDIYTPYDSDQFLEEVNDHYYIKEGSRLTVNSLKTLDAVGSDIVDFDLMFNDTSEYSSLLTLLTNNRFTALANSFFDDEDKGGLVIKDDDDTPIGVAKIIQTKIYSDKLDMAILFGFSLEDEDKKTVLPEYIFIHTSTDIVAVDEFDVKTYPTDVIINSFNNASETEDLFSRIKLLSDSFGLPMDVSIDDIKSAITENVAKIFDEYLVMFGEVTVNENHIKIPNLFEYLAGGKLDKDGTGKALYDATNKMKDDNGELTDPEVLRYRLQELGKKDNLFISNTDSRMIVWYDGKPYESYDDNTLPKTYRNTNMFSDTDSDKFFSDIEALYFFKTTPDSNSFHTIAERMGNGESLSGLLNLRGSLGLSYIPSATTDAEIMNNYKYFGLYNYLETQLSPVLSDKAMGSIINKQSAAEISDKIASVDSLEFSSVVLNVISSTKMTLEITMKIYPNNTDYLPEFFYVTSYTTRELVGISYEYATSITINRFSVQDSVDFKANINHLSTFDLSSDLNYDDIANQVNQAVSDFFEVKLIDYISSFDNYSAAEKESGKGYGYVILKNFYEILVDKTTVEGGESRKKLNDLNDIVGYNASLRTCLQTTSETLIQNILVKLHNVNNDLLANKILNDTEYSSILSSMIIGGDSYTDKELAVALNELISDVNVCQSVIFKGYVSQYDEYEAILLDSSNTYYGDSFTGFDKISDLAPYILITANISLSDVTSGIDFLPDNIYGSVLFDEDSTALNIFFNDLSFEETELLKIIINDTNGDLDIKSQLEDALDFIKGSSTWNYYRGDFTTHYGSFNR